MSTVIEFLSFIWKILVFLLEFIISLPGMIVNAVMGIATTIYGLVTNAYSCLDAVYTVFHASRDHVEAFLSIISESYTWSFFYRLFSLDVMGQLFSSFVSLAILVMTFTLFELFFTAVCTAVPFLIYKAIGKLIQAVSVGYAKPT